MTNHLLTAAIILFIAAIELSLSTHEGDGSPSDGPLANPSPNLVNVSAVALETVPVTTECLHGMWPCDEDLFCLPLNDTCPGVPQCQGESNEDVVPCRCLEEEFECQGQCLPNLLRCNTVPDCKGGEDEIDCDTWPCPSSHFKCHNGFCVPSEAVCNFLDDCGDDSDEEECDHRRCYFKEFRCQNGQCIRPGLVCDGTQDCYDGTDEQQCQPDDFAVCASGEQVHRFYWCDQWPECEDNHADETRCGNCSSSHHMCPNRRCISKANLCDGQCDCSDCTDEAICEHVYDKLSGIPRCTLGVSVPCMVNPFARSLDRCISMTFLCDGANQCHNGRQLNDETGCDVSDCDEGLSKLLRKPRRFRCHSDRRCLPYDVRCDFKIDCLYGEDEQNCEFLSCSEDEWRCSSGQCVPLNAICNLTFECQDRSDEMFCDDHRCQDNLARCSSGQCLPRDRWCDYYPDCPDGSDESHCAVSEDCGPHQFRCADGQQCVAVEDRCIVSRDRHIGCADKSHLIGCREFQCQPGMFKCHYGPCLSTNLTCDRVPDCPNTWDDEDFCPFECSSTAPGCRCFHLEADCAGLAMTSLPDIEPQINRYLFSRNNLSSVLHPDTFVGRSNLVYLDLSENRITKLPRASFRPLWRLRILLLKDNHLTFLSEGAFLGLHLLRTLDLSGNSIASIEPLSFSGLSALSTLDLSSQNLSYVSPRAFVGLRNLTMLTMERNSLVELQELVFVGLNELQHLSLENNLLDRVNARTFSTMALLKYLATDERRWCCLAPDHIQCLPPPDEFSSCADLMSNPVLRVCIWVLGIVALLGNSLVIVWRSFYSTGNKLHSFLIVNLAIGDLLMGAYLLVIAAVDFHLRGIYATKEASWRRSALCRTAGFCSTLSSELSVFTLTVITVDRLMVIKFPFSARRYEKRIIRGVMVWVWLTVIFLAAIPLLPIDSFANFYGRSGVCLALHITNERPNGWQYAVFVFIVLNFLSFAAIAISYLLMYLTAKRTQRAARDGHNPCRRVRVRSQRIENSVSSSSSSLLPSMGPRMTLIVATDAACWLPIIVLGLLSLGGVIIPPQIYAWIAVFILPLNAAINPLLYTLSTTPVRQRIHLLSQARSHVSSTRRFTLTLSGSTLKSSLRTRLASAPISEGALIETRIVGARATSSKDDAPYPKDVGKFPLGGRMDSKGHACGLWTTLEGTSLGLRTAAP